MPAADVPLHPGPALRDGDGLLRAAVKLGRRLQLRQQWMAHQRTLWMDGVEKKRNNGFEKTGFFLFLWCVCF